MIAAAAADGAAASADVTEADVSEADAAAVEAAAWEILDDFNRRDVRGESQVSLTTPGGVAALKASLLLAAEAALRDESARPLLGICAGSVEEGFASLRQYLLALGCADPALLDQPGGLLVTWQDKHSKEVLGPAYIKFNSNSKTCQVSPYQTGTFRGVIVQPLVPHYPPQFLFLFPTPHPLHINPPTPCQSTHSYPLPVSSHAIAYYLLWPSSLPHCLSLTLGRRQVGHLPLSLFLE
ncbi:unnamed protein product [Closterium sp. Naga37s-1]|nr:unnamed protein product [Closterium sp. Naga37s-1]